MRSLETTSGHLEMTSKFVTQQQMRESCQMLRQLLEVAVTTESSGGLPAIQFGRNTHFRLIHNSVKTSA